MNHVRQVSYAHHYTKVPADGSGLALFFKSTLVEENYFFARSRFIYIPGGFAFATGNSRHNRSPIRK